MPEGRVGELKYLIQKYPQSWLALGATMLSSVQGEASREGRFHRDLAWGAWQMLTNGRTKEQMKTETLAFTPLG